jgi:hypothetical protein
VKQLVRSVVALLSLKKVFVFLEEEHRIRVLRGTFGHGGEETAFHTSTALALEMGAVYFPEMLISV